MAWTFTDDIGGYQRTVRDLFSSDPERNTVLASVLATLVRVGPTAYGSDPPVLGWWPTGGRVRAAVLRTPPHAMLITALPDESAAELAQALADRGIALPGINGAQQDTAALARAWRDVTGVGGQVTQRQRLYRLAELSPPDPAPDGAAKVATPADAAVAQQWFADFSAETGTGSPGGLVADRLANGQLMLWEVDGEPTSIAGITGVVAGTARVGPVYTPPAVRGRGYGAAVTAAITELAKARGASSVVLFTDLANPTSNSLYIRLGYEPVEDRALLMF